MILGVFFWTSPYRQNTCTLHTGYNDSFLIPDFLIQKIDSARLNSNSNPFFGFFFFFLYNCHI